MRRPVSGAVAVLLAIEFLDELVFGAREAAWPPDPVPSLRGLRLAVAGVAHGRRPRAARAEHGALDDRRLGWRPVFVGLAAAAAVLALTALRVPSGTTPIAVREGVRGAWRALRRRALLRWLVLLEMSDLLLDVLRGFLAVYLVDEAGLSRGTAALAVSVVLGADLAGNFAVLRLLRTAGGLVYLRASAVVAAGLFVAFLLVPGVVKLVPLAALGAMTAGWYPILKARLYDELPGRSGTAMTLGSLMGPLGSAAPLAVGFLAGAAGLDAALWLLLLGPATLLALVPRRR